MLILNSFTLSDNTQVHLSVLNNRTASVYPVDDKYEIKDETNGKILSISYNNGEYVISKGDIITIGKNKFKINAIEKSSTSFPNKNTYNLFTFRKETTTAFFIMPFLGYSKIDWHWSTYFVNAFVNKEITQVQLLYRFSGSTDFAKFEDSLKKLPNYVTSVDLDSYNTLYTFTIPEKFQNDSLLISNSKYSHISEEGKQRILTFHHSNLNKPLGQILYKCAKRRDKMSKELALKIPIENELYDLFKIDEELFLESYILDNNGQKRKRVPPGGFV